MRTIESMKSEKQKISPNIEKLRNRERELEKDIEQASMREIWEESIKQFLRIYHSRVSSVLNEMDA